MTKRIVLVVLALGLAWLYMWVVTTTIAYAASQPSPPGWGALFNSRGSEVLAWLVFVHTLAVLLASLPFAFAIERLYGRVGVWVALALTVAVYSATLAPFVVGAFAANPVRLKVVNLIDAVTLVGFLPALVWVFGMLPSNYRIERPREP
jgi:hypothetical protein